MRIALDQLERKPAAKLLDWRGSTPAIASREAGVWRSTCGVTSLSPAVLHAVWNVVRNDRYGEPSRWQKTDELSVLWRTLAVLFESCAQDPAEIHRPRLA